MHSPQDLIELDRRHLWHPFTAMAQWRLDQPLVIERAEGDYLVDTEGRRYIDGVSSLWCNVHGHRVAQIDQAVRGQLDKVAHTTLLGLVSPPSVELAAMLVQRAPGKLNKVFYCDAGAAALEVAFKIAVGYWYHTGEPHKNRFIGFAGAYHGDTTGAMSVGYSDLFHRPFLSMVFPTHIAPAPASGASTPLAASHHPTTKWPSEDPALSTALKNHCLAELEKLLKRYGDETAAVVIEPIMQGAGGMICQPPGFLAGVADLARKYDTLLIADEVATGFGRTGKLFACEHEKVEPDIMCLGKGISAGYLPLAATLVTDRIEQAFCGEFSEQKTLYHGHTYTGNALACAAAIASLKLFDQSHLLEHIEQSAGIITDQLEVLSDCPQVFDVRQRGIMVGIELCRDRASRVRLDPALRTGAKVCMAMREQGLILRPLGDVIVLMPIPAMRHEVLRKMLAIVTETLMHWRWQ